MQTVASNTAGWIRILALAAVGLIETFGADPAVVFPGMHWVEATPESRGIDSARLKAAVADLDRGLSPEGAAELVIVRDGYLIWNGPHCDAYHQIFSCTKVFTSTVLGLLIDDGKCDPRDLAIRYLPALEAVHPPYAKLQLRHLATMTGGYRGVVRNVTVDQPWGDPLGYLTPQSPRYDPGTACAYHDHDVFLLGNALTRLAGESLATLFKRRIADPIGMTRWDWGIAGTLDNGLLLNNVAGTPSRTPGIQTSTRELARFGHLFLNRGLWNGRRLLSASFIEQATSTQVPASLPHSSGADPAGHYGFYWWTNGRQRNGAQPWPDAPLGTCAAQGGSGNFCFVIPEWNMVVVRLGTNTLTRSAVTDALWNRFFGQVGRAIQSPAAGVTPIRVRDTDRPAEPASASAASRRFPSASELPSHPELPDPLVMLDGRRVTTREQWFNERRPELIALFQHYMYGLMPPPPQEVVGRIERVDRGAFGGKATLKEVAVTFGPSQLPPMQLMLVVPNRRQGPAPVVLGMNYFGNHTLVRDPGVRLSTQWMPERGEGVVNNRSTDASRGTWADIWRIDYWIERGYAVATFYNGDIDPDRPDQRGIQAHFRRPDPQDDCGTIGAWAWGLSRAVDYLVTDADVDKRRIIVTGHSRLGKAALLAAAFDERIALAIPHQAGCGGSAPSRSTIRPASAADSLPGRTPRKPSETVKQINEAFPHWFNARFKEFNDRPDRLPFDQHCLVALCAPRPVLFTNGRDDTWINPEGQFEVLRGAAPVYRLLGAGDFTATELPPDGKLLNGTLGYFIRPGGHSLKPEDWKAFFDFADKHLVEGVKP